MNINIGKFTALAIIVAAIAFLSALQAGYLHLAEVGIWTAAVIGSIFVGYEAYRKTGGIPGPVITGTALANLVIGVLLQTLPSLLGGTQITSYSLIVWGLATLGVLETEVEQIGSSTQAPAPTKTA